MHSNRQYKPAQYEAVKGGTSEMHVTDPVHNTGTMQAGQTHSQCSEAPVNTVNTALPNNNTAQYYNSIMLTIHNTNSVQYLRCTILTLHNTKTA